ncbi:MAG: hypothetical protein ACPHTC_07475 [Candidatus Puniceispirillaceae bacterium]
MPISLSWQYQGRLCFSLLIDHLGLFGPPIRAVHLVQLGGASMLLGDYTACGWQIDGDATRG